MRIFLGWEPLVSPRHEQGIVIRRTDVPPLVVVSSNTRRGQSTLRHENRLLALSGGEDYMCRNCFGCFLDMNQ